MARKTKEIGHTSSLKDPWEFFIRIGNSAGQRENSASSHSERSESNQSQFNMNEDSTWDYLLHLPGC